jgi:ferrous iron transport protein A
MDAKRTSLDQLEPGQPAAIAGLNSEPALRARMMAMGLRVGRELAVIRASRFGGPLQVRVGTTDLVMRRHEARQVEVMPLDCDSCTAPCPNSPA